MIDGMSTLSLVCNGIGVVGFMIYMTNYTLVTFQRIDSRGVLFFCLNTLAASCVLISLSQNFNLASAMIQIVWICLGSIAIRKRIVKRRRTPDHPFQKPLFPASAPQSGAI
ncbi:hypothetical protein C0U40_06545 [Amylibacter cionae]|nr:hypothetical protein C0U40_06545 [Amylibacter cionae]